MDPKEVELRDFLDALDGAPPWFFELRHAVERIDAHAGAVPLDRVKQTSLSLVRDPPKRSVAAILNHVFYWAETPEGYTYWHSIYCKLEGDEHDEA